MGKTLMVLIVAAILFTLGVRPTISAATASIGKMNTAMARVNAAADAGR